MKKMKKVLIVLVSLLLLLVIVLIVINRRANRVYKDESYVPSISYDNQYQYEPNVVNSHYNALNTNDKTHIDDVINFLVQAINEKNYEALYQKLPEEYQEVRYPTLQDFQTYMKRTFPEECHATSYEITDYGCLVHFGFANRTETPSIQVNGYKSSAEDRYTLYMEELVTVEKQDLMFAVSREQLNFHNKMMIRYPDKTVFVLTVMNQSEKPVTLDFQASTLVKKKGGYKYTYPTLEMEPVQVPAKTNMDIEIPFDFSMKQAYVPDFIDYIVQINEFRSYEKKLSVADNSDPFDDMGAEEGLEGDGEEEIEEEDIVEEE